MVRFLFLAALLAGAAPAATPAGSPAFDHKEAFEHYQGTATCLECHRGEAEAFFRSQHYQWRGETPGLSNAGGQRLGKLNTVNDFCTNPLPSWIGEVRNSAGQVVSQGCSKCHAGRGLVPQETLSEEQLANIDCLICHAAGYRRDLYPKEGGGWEWKPILWKNQEGLDAVSKRIGQPTRRTCLRCHAGAGGGPNYKRGDLEYALAECDSNYDVHMGADGANLECVACHRGEGHRVRGRGADLAGTDMPGATLSCATSGCHDAAPHRDTALNRHTARVACAACHVPTFARTDPTDMARNWSQPVYKPESGKYSATIDLQKDVRPVYAWFNGRTRIQTMGVPVTRQADGTVGVMLPEGSREDPAARIAPFKLHRGRMPVLIEGQRLLPIAVEQFFADGDIDAAVREAARVSYGAEETDYEWVDTVRYMGIYHGVVPVAQALRCNDCHGTAGRLDWKALGYDGDPRRR